MTYFIKPLALSLAVTLLGCQEQELMNGESPTQPVTSIQQRDFSTFASQAVHKVGNNFVSSSESKGLHLLSQSNTAIDHIAGRFEFLDSRKSPSGADRLVTVDKNTNTLVLISPASNSLGKLTPQATPSFNIDGLCLYADDNKLYSFLINGDGHAEQWLLNTDADSKLLDHSKNARLVRQFPVAPGSYCSVDDVNHRLYISEEKTGIWAYDAHPEAQPDRQLVALVKPWGQNIGEDVAGIAAFNGGVFAVSASDQRISGFYFNKGSSEYFASKKLTATSDSEYLSLQQSPESAELISVDSDAQIEQFSTQLTAPEVSEAPFVVLQAQVETQPMPRLGDVADDPAIWHNAKHPEQSLVLATNKTAGLHVYDLQGQEKQFLKIGRLNNVDIRYAIKVGEQTLDVAAASLRNDNTVALFSINPNTGNVKHHVNFATGMEAIYGLCMSQFGAGSEKQTYVFANDKSGLYHQYLIYSNNDKLESKLVRQFSVNSQPEGCVADDQNKQLFVGEENAGIWQFDARPDTNTEPRLVAKIGKQLKDDVEGLAIYHGDTNDYLVVSSQGNNSYAIFDTEAPFRYRGSFKIGMNARLDIDGSSETDGLEVSSQNFGGVFKEGMLVVQDGHNVLPSEAQNFKYIDWQQIRKALKLEH